MARSTHSKGNLRVRETLAYAFYHRPRTGVGRARYRGGAPRVPRRARPIPDPGLSRERRPAAPPGHVGSAPRPAALRRLVTSSPDSATSTPSARWPTDSLGWTRIGRPPDCSEKGGVRSTPPGAGRTRRARRRPYRGSRRRAVGAPPSSVDGGRRVPRTGCSGAASSRSARAPSTCYFGLTPPPLSLAPRSAVLAPEYLPVPALASAGPK